MGTAVTDEPTAIRNPTGHEWHRPEPILGQETICHRWVSYHSSRVPLSRTNPADRCRICWPTPKEQS